MSKITLKAEEKAEERGIQNMKSSHAIVFLFLTIFLTSCFHNENSNNSEPTYTIGGALTGHQGSALIIQVTGSSAGAELLSITNNGNFSFNSPFTNGNSYDVTVTTQPQIPAQTCTVINGSGTVSGADILDVSISCSVDAIVLTQSELATIPNANFVGAVIDENDNLYLADQGNNSIIKVDANGVVTELVSNIMNLGVGIAELEVAGNELYFIETNSDTIFKIDLSASTFPIDFSSTSTVTASSFATGTFAAPGGLTHDTLGNFYISSLASNNDSGYISQIDNAGTLTNLNWLNFTVNGAWATLVIDENNAIYVAQPSNISKIDSTGTVTTIVDSLQEPVGLFYTARVLYFTDDYAVYRYTFTYDLLEELYLTANLPETDLTPGKTRVLVDSNGKIIIVSKSIISILQ